TSHGICSACVVTVSRELPDDIPSSFDRICATHCRVVKDITAERSTSPMSADTPTSPVDETPQTTSGEALLRRVRATRRRAHDLRAAARAARQPAKPVQEYA